MKNLILAAFAALSLSAAVAPFTNAAVFQNGSPAAGDAATPDRAQVAASATEQLVSQAPASAPDAVAPASAGFGKDIVTVGFGWG
jgi:hypothetical protein